MSTNKKSGLKKVYTCMIVFLFLCVRTEASAQSILVNMGPIDGVDITPDNILGFQVQSTYASAVSTTVRGSIHYRGNDNYINFTFHCQIQPGLNSFSADVVHPVWQYSSSALRELFTEYKVLPQGTYEYCINIYPGNVSGDGSSVSLGDDCLYRQAEDLFMITLTEPENNAKLYEYNPLLSWICTYPFAQSLTYRVRVAEIKNGQNNVNAISRNNPVYEERDVVQPSIVYPVYAKQLQAYQPYAWTVDAYYKGLLLGGAEPWRFTIVEDTLLLASIPKNVSYLDIRKENGGNLVFAIGKLKLKYVLDDLKADTLTLHLFSNDNKEIKLKQSQLKAAYGDNRYDIDFSSDPALRHLKVYKIDIINAQGGKYSVSFRYVNPEYLK